MCHWQVLVPRRLKPPQLPRVEGFPGWLHQCALGLAPQRRVRQTWGQQLQGVRGETLPFRACRPLVFGVAASRCNTHPAHMGKEGTWQQRPPALAATVPRALPAPRAAHLGCAPTPLTARPPARTVQLPTPLCAEVGRACTQASDEVKQTAHTVGKQSATERTFMVACHAAVSCSASSSSTRAFGVDGGSP